MNACDAGREGELIFAYVYRDRRGGEAGRAAVAVVDDQAAISEAFERLRAGEEMKPLEAAARSRSEADWVVGMNATRAASIRLRAAFDGAVSLGRVQTPDARARRPPRGGDPRLQARALLARRGAVRGDAASAATPAATWAASACRPRTRPRRSSRPCSGQPGRDHQAREEGGARAARSSSTTSPRSSATPTRSTASRRAARSPPRSGSTRSTRRSPTRVPTRAS